MAHPITEIAYTTHAKERMQQRDIPDVDLSELKPFRSKLKRNPRMKLRGVDPHQSLFLTRKRGIGIDVFVFNKQPNKFNQHVLVTCYTVYPDA